MYVCFDLFADFLNQICLSYFALRIICTSVMHKSQALYSFCGYALCIINNSSEYDLTMALLKINSNWAV